MNRHDTAAVPFGDFARTSAEPTTSASDKSTSTPQGDLAGALIMGSNDPTVTKNANNITR
ncbi:hypothetical protein EDD27_8825 [Nonomuraea polychroma]|uniref:Uncharacterized protein n=1 Tax=Nonomuraea polychroma TaxID=46176 RepID=A0A438MKB9_9ACTN|nr:hypothetical protein EDD27_8825 [Nonomuraea polychroma]